ncbi:ABC transporter permease subunit [Nocardioides lianchengensis]|uniref:ABC-2 type transport system permease protein n=1 Tax=Nocardioides lianchengensis TaxID=1045774 RepID=A0A1G6Y077_9ACTN|nr:ABC transporter permease subunit [Nocardioides lianchengensis]NYG13485.1 ABC-2 type transport system permease protein [Nocardioides lianchengensis]SDD83117.1 ABC-2 type transport system permease protein [Nocardioides lianchengensis]
MSATAIGTTERATASYPPQTFGRVLHGEWIKFWSVRSTRWSLVALVVLGVGLTAMICASSADWLASGDADESPGSFVTWGMMLAQVTGVVLGAMVVTSEYGTGMIRSTLAAVPRRGRVLAAKAVVLTGVLLVAGTVTAFAGYLAGNFFLDRAGVGVPLDGDGVVRALFGNGLYLATLGLLTAAVGLLVRHTAAALSIVLGTVFVVGTMANLLPGTWGEWVSKLLPGNAGMTIATPVSFNPEALGPWTGFGVLVLETVVVLAAGWWALVRRDA